VGVGGIAFVCFRSPADEFFTLIVPAPFYVKRHFDPATKQFAPDEGATDDQARGFLTAFANGIQDPSAIPINFVHGTWTHLLGSDMFAAKLVDGSAVDNDSFGFWIDSSQVSAFTRYQNRVEKDVSYRFVIQRSTGRFSEVYRRVGEKVPFSERNGRCSIITPTPR
jgi:hypothetical protein